MASLILTFKELYEEVEKYLGTYNSGSAAAADITDAKMIVNRAYARFVGFHDWTFLYQKRTIDLKVNEYIYELPSEFIYLTWNKLLYDADDGYPPILQRSPGQIINLRSDSDYSSIPMYFALQAGEYHKETGQAWEIMLYPKPDDTYRLSYWCKISPEKLESDGDYPIGGAEMSEVLLELCLSFAEMYKEEGKINAFSGRIQEVLGPAVGMDRKRRTAQLGSLNSDYVNIPLSDVHNGTLVISS